MVQQGQFLALALGSFCSFSSWPLSLIKGSLPLKLNMGLSGAKILDLSNSLIFPLDVATANRLSSSSTIPFTEPLTFIVFIRRGLSASKSLHIFIFPKRSPLAKLSSSLSCVNARISEPNLLKVFSGSEEK